MHRVFVYDNGGNLQNYCDALTSAGLHPCISTENSLAARCDGLLLPGGGDIHPARYGQAVEVDLRLDSRREEAEFCLLEQFLKVQKPIFGICLGMQMLNVAFGGDLRQWVPGHGPDAEDRDSLHETTISAGSPLAVYGERAVVNSYHRQAVGRIGSGLEAAQWTADGIVEALWHGNLPVLGVQWHPERLTGTRRREGAVDGGALFCWFREQIENTKEI